MAEWIDRTKPSATSLRRMVREVLCAIEHIHMNGVLHCDIKLENVLMQQLGSALSISVGHK